MRVVPLLIGGAAVLAVAGVAYAATQEDERKVWLIRGKKYAIVHRLQGAGWDASMYPGFCNFSQPVITGQANSTHDTITRKPGLLESVWTEVQFTAEWCADNMQWDVPSNVAIAEV